MRLAFIANPNSPVAAHLVLPFVRAGHEGAILRDPGAAPAGTRLLIVRPDAEDVPPDSFRVPQEVFDIRLGGLESFDPFFYAGLRYLIAVAVLLPVAFYAMAERQLPPVAALRRHGVPIAVASDCNPGSAPGASLLLAMNMARRLFGLTSEEVLLGVTRHYRDAGYAHVDVQPETDLDVHRPDRHVRPRTDEDAEVVRQVRGIGDAAVLLGDQRRDKSTEMCCQWANGGANERDSALVRAFHGSLLTGSSAWQGG